MSEYWAKASAEEREFLEQYDPSKFPTITVTVDLIVFSNSGGEPWVLLIERGNYPYKGYWALPGGFIDPNERALDAARRELNEEAGLDIPLRKIKQIGTADDPNRDPRGRCISIVHRAEVEGLPEAYAGDDARAAEWVTVKEALRRDLAFDHRLLLLWAHEQWEDELTHANT